MVRRTNMIMTLALALGLVATPARADRNEDRQKVSIELAICAVANERLSGTSQWASEQREAFAQAELLKGFIERYNLMRANAYMYYWKIASKVLDGNQEYRSNPKAFVTWCNKQSEGTIAWAHNAKLHEQQAGDINWYVPFE